MSPANGKGVPLIISKEIGGGIKIIVSQGKTFWIGGAHQGLGLGLGRDREWEGRAFCEVSGMQTVISGMDGPWDLSVQHREMCVIGSLCCTTEPDRTL